MKEELNEKEIGNRFRIKGLIGEWILYGIEINSGNDYGLSKFEFPYRYYFYSEDNKENSKKIDNVNQVIKLTNEQNNKKTMKITNLIKKILDKDTRTLVEANFINGDLALTESGVNELIGIMFLEKKEELVKIAKEKIVDERLQRA